LKRAIAASSSASSAFRSSSDTDWPVRQYALHLIAAEVALGCENVGNSLPRIANELPDKSDVMSLSNDVRICPEPPGAVRVRMEKLKKSDLFVGISVGVAVGLAFMVTLVLLAILLFPRYFDIWDRGAAPTLQIQSQ
jgi:hypothetical protein